MTSLSGTKERSVTSRTRKYGMTDTSPTKSASFSPETWYRKAYEESRAGGRPAPEGGAGSMPSSTGTPSPGSGTSSPGSFSGSPGTISPGIGTGSPGSLGGSPGFGTGSPGSASGSSPGSERGVWCENCNARLAELKRQALKLLIPGPYSSKDPSFSLLLHDKLQVPNTSRRAWNERDSRCDVCSTHLTQLKQEAVHMVFTLDHWDLSPSSPPSLPGRAVHHGPPGPPGPPRDWALLPSSGAASAYPAPAPQQAPQPSSQTPIPVHAALGPGSASLGQTASPAPLLASQAPGPSPSHQGGLPRHGSKPSSLGLGRNGSPGHLAKAAGPAQPLPPNSPGSHGNAAVLNTAALQAHQYRTTGVTLYPYQISQMGESSREALTEAALNHYNTGPASSPSQATPTLPVATATPTTTSAAASFFARAAQKLNLTSKRRKQRPAPPPVPSDPPLFPTNFSGTLQLAPPPAPPCLLRAASKVKDTPGLGKVKVMVRVCPLSSPEAAESSSFLKVDPRKKQVTIMDPSANQTQGNTPQKRGGANQVPPKMFAFDAAFPHDASQAEVCAGTVAEVIQSVVNGADGCVFCFGHSRLGKSYTMIGRDDSMQTLGVIPCSISWLFKLINERKEKTAARFSVRVSAVEVWGKEESLKDLLSEVATGSLQDGQSPGVYLCEDPICGMQLQNQSELRAPTAEKAAFFLDAALAARSCSQPDSHQDHHRTSHMLFTLHIYQYRMEKSSKGGMSGGRSRLHLIDLGSCVKVLGKTRDSPSHCPAPGPAPGPAPTPCPALCLTLSALGNVILALVNGSKHIPYKESKLTMLLRESLGNINCRTTMIAHISSSPGNFSETLSTIQIASRVLRMKKKKSKVSVQYTSSSSGGDSSCEEGRMRRPTQLRPFPSRGGGASGSELPLLRLHSDQDGYSSSEQSCDTVIYVGPGGGAVSDRELTDNEGPPDLVPIIPALLGGKAEPPPPLPQQQQTLLAPAPPPTQSAPSQLAQPPPPAGPQPPQPPQGPLPLGALAPVPEEAAECLKCNTFAELQERLDCIDGSEEVPKFPFEEGPATQGGGKQEPPQEPPQDPPASASPPWRQSNDQQLQDIREVLEEAELAQTMIHNLVTPSGLSGSKSVTGAGAGAGGTLVSPLQRAKSASLHDSRESLSAGSSSDGKPRPLGSPRLGIASLTRTSDYRPPSSPSQRCKVYTQKGVMPGTPPLSSQNLAADSLAADSLAADSLAADSLAADSLAADSLAADSLAADSGRSSSGSVLQLESLSRTSPLGLSPQVLERALSLSGSLGSAETLCDDDVPQIPLDSRAEGPVLSAVAPGEALCVVEDGLLCSMRAPGGRPSSIISFSSDCSVVAMASGSRPVSIISGVSEDLERHVARTTAAAVTGAVVAKAEVAMAKLRVEGEAMAKMPSGRSSISSWLSELSVGSEADHSLHSFSQSQGPGEALAEPDPTSGALAGPEGLGEASGGPGGEAVEGEVVFSEKGTPTKDRLRRLPPSQGRSSSSTSGVQNFPFKTSITTQPCVAVKPMLIQEPTILSSPTKTSLLKHPAKPAPTPASACTPAPGFAQGPVLVSMSSEIIFDDPWMRRDGEDVRPKELVCEVKPEKRQADPARSQIQAQAWAQGPEKAEQAWDRRSSSSGEAVCVSSPDSCRREVALAGGAGETPVYSPDVHRTSSLPRGWHRLNRHDGLDASGEYRSLGVTTSTPCSPRATLDRRGSSGRLGLFSRQRGVPPLPPVRKSSLDQRNRAQGALSPLHGPSHGLSFLGSMPEDLGGSGGGVRMKGMESSRLFTAKLEQLASRTNSLGRSHGGAPGTHGPHYDCFSLERGESLRGGGGGGRGDSTMPRTGRSLTRAGSLSSSSSSSNGNGGGAVLSPKSGPSKISAVSKLLMASPKARSLSTSSTKTLSFSTKSLPQAVNRSSSLPPNGKAQVAQAQGPISGQSQGQSQGQGASSGASWSTQSLSRGSRAGGLAAKLPLRAVNGRISELLQGGGGGGSRSGGGHTRTGGGGGAEAGGEERGVAAVASGSGGNHGDEKPAAAPAQALPSPYSKITAPRRPHRCSSGHASDNSSVLSGELPPAMGKTALFYHSGGSSGYESMLRDSSENTGSTSSAQDSVSEASSACSRRSLKNSKKRSNTGTQRRRLIPSLTLDSSSPSSSVSSPVRKPAASPGARWVDGPLRPAEPFEIKVYEIDDVERLQRRRERGTKEVMYFSARLQILENRQQRISEVRARYDWLKKELEQTKMYLMLEPEKWTSEFDLQPVYELDSLEYLEALEVMTRRLQTRVNFCKAHLMMVTCFDMACRRR